MDKSNPPGGGRVGAGPSPTSDRPAPTSTESKRPPQSVTTLSSQKSPIPVRPSGPPPSGAESPELIARRLDRVRIRAPHLAASLEFTMYLAAKTGLPALKELEDLLVRLDEKAAAPGASGKTGSGGPPASRSIPPRSQSRGAPKAPAVSLRAARTAVSMRVSGGNSGLLVVILAMLIASEIVGLVWIWIKTS